MTQRILYLILFLGISMIQTGCFDPDDYNPKETETRIELNPADTTIVANGVSRAKIKFQVISDIPSKSLPIVFKTTAGNFVGGKGDSLVVQPSRDYKTSVNLTSTTTGTAKITAKIGSIVFPNTATVNFSKAFPDKISVAVDSFAIHNSFQSEVVINAALTISTGGVASSGHAVEFAAYTEGGTSIGYYINNDPIGFTNSAGKVSIRFTVGNSSYTGQLRIVASSLDANGGIITDETFIQVID